MDLADLSIAFLLSTGENNEILHAELAKLFRSDRPITPTVRAALADYYERGAPVKKPKKGRPATLARLKGSSLTAKMGRRTLRDAFRVRVKKYREPKGTVVDELAEGLGVSKSGIYELLGMAKNEADFWTPRN